MLPSEDTGCNARNADPLSLPWTLRERTITTGNITSHTKAVRLNLMMYGFFACASAKKGSLWRPPLMCSAESGRGIGREPAEMPVATTSAARSPNFGQELASWAAPLLAQVGASDKYHDNTHSKALKNNPQSRRDDRDQTGKLHHERTWLGGPRAKKGTVTHGKKDTCMLVYTRQLATPSVSPLRRVRAVATRAQLIW